MSEPNPASRRVLLAAALTVAGSANAQTNDPAQLAAIIERYAVALRSNDVEALVTLFAANGVFMRQDLPAAVGTEALRASYRKIFATLKVELCFEISETEVAGDMAWVRTISKGPIKTLATGKETDGSFNGLFVFRRESGTWKIRCYLFASNKPGTGTPQ